MQTSLSPPSADHLIAAFHHPLAEHVRATLRKVEDELHDSVASPSGPWLTDAARYLVTAGGKRLRPLLVILAGNAAGVPDPERIVDAAVCVELVHVATLHHDDVMDNARLRHGVVSANLRWGNRLAVLIGDHLMASAAMAALRLGLTEVKHQAQTVDRLVRGQFLECLPVGPDDDPVARYFQVAADKSAALFGWAAWAGGRCAGADEPTSGALCAYGEALGLAFQISDDLLDIVADPATSGKTPGADLRAGVRSLPVLRALAARGPAADRFRELIGTGPIDDEARVLEAVKLLRDSPAIEETFADLVGYATDARDALRLLPPGPGRDALQQLCDFVVGRSS